MAGDVRAARREEFGVFFGRRISSGNVVTSGCSGFRICNLRYVCLGMMPWLSVGHGEGFRSCNAGDYTLYAFIRP